MNKQKSENWERNLDRVFEICSAYKDDTKLRRAISLLIREILKEKEEEIKKLRARIDRKTKTVRETLDWLQDAQEEFIRPLNPLPDKSGPLAMINRP